VGQVQKVEKVHVHGLANNWKSGVVTESESVKEIAKAQERYDSKRMVLVSIGDQPKVVELVSFLDANQHVSKRLVVMKHPLQVERIVHLGIVLQRIDLVVSYESFQRQSVLLVIIYMQSMGFLVV
jgi:hypothetical protein